MPRICIVEDDVILRQELVHLLELNGYEASVCEDYAQAASRIASQRPDLAIVDLKVPGADGHSICRDLRKRSAVPILVLTSSDSEFDEVMSMKLGADDYLTKPYRPAVLLAHVNRLLQRAGNVGAARIEFAGITLDMARATLLCGGNDVALSRNETCILAALIRARGAIVSRQDLMRELWETDQFVDDNTLTVNVNRVRKALERAGAPAGTLKTHRGLGYSL